jgi:hypothetical protein
MTISNYRSAEALYVVIVRDRNAEQQLKDWSKGARVSVTIEGNRMKLFDTRALSLFQIDWPYNWEVVTIWDCWNRRHI